MEEKRKARLLLNALRARISREGRVPNDKEVAFMKLQETIIAAPLTSQLTTAANATIANMAKRTAASRAIVSRRNLAAAAAAEEEAFEGFGEIQEGVNNLSAVLARPLGPHPKPTNAELNAYLAAESGGMGPSLRFPSVPSESHGSASAAGAPGPRAPYTVPPKIQADLEPMLPELVKFFDDLTVLLAERINEPCKTIFGKPAPPSCATQKENIDMCLKPIYCYMARIDLARKHSSVGPAPSDQIKTILGEMKNKIRRSTVCPNKKYIDMLDSNPPVQFAYLLYAILDQLIALRENEGCKAPLGRIVGLAQNVRHKHGQTLPELGIDRFHAALQPINRTLSVHMGAFRDAPAVSAAQKAAVKAVFDEAESRAAAASLQARLNALKKKGGARRSKKARKTRRKNRKTSRR